DITSLEELCAVWKENPPDARYKRHLVIAVAKLARNIHEHGVNHRDFYLCHLCLHNEASNLQLYLIDLHRALIHKEPSKKANMKDIAALYFSAMGTVLTAKDYLRFRRYYHPQDKQFWREVERRAQVLNTKFNSKKFQKRLQVESDKLNS
ncbi:MAG: lipopolysaccharide kinase InaA family protein, partial [Methylophilaceae bacterium]